MEFFINTGRYDDIINLPHHVSSKYPPMSLDARSAQFASFACLTGYDDVIEEAGRLTNKRIEIDESIKEILNKMLLIIESKLSERFLVTFIYFVSDLKKDGGEYKRVTGVVKKIDRYKQIIFLEDGTQIPILDIINISSENFGSDIV